MEKLYKVSLPAVCIFMAGIFNLESFSQNVSPEILTEKIFTEWNAPQKPGVAVAIIKDGKFLYEKAYGLANLEYNIPNSTTTLFEIGSVSKQFTAFAILLLEDRGKLSLDDDIRTYLPEFPDYGKTITIKNLLYHTSGIRDEMDLLCMAGWSPKDIITHQQIINLACKQMELSFPPGNEYRYSNTNYTLLAEIVARVSGQSFSDFATANIFRPLGMNHTLVFDNCEKVVPGLASSYFPEGNEFHKNILSSSNFGSSNILSNIEDLSLWVRNFEVPKIGNMKLIQKMNECGTLNNGDKIEYAMGQEIIRYRGVTIINHNGALGGFRSQLVRFPEQKLSIILLSNNATFDTQGAAFQIAGIYLKDQFKDEPQVTETSADAGGSGDPQLLALYAGRFELRPGFVINVTANGGGLFVEAHEVPYTRLVQVSPNEFELPAMHAKLTFKKDQNGDYNQIDILLNDQPMMAKRLLSFNADFVNPELYKGNYYSHELGTVYSFTAKNGQLYGSHNRLGEFEMKPVNSDQFATDKWFLKRIEFIRNEKNEITGCLVAGGRITNIKFTKID